MTGYIIAIVLFNVSGEYLRTDTYAMSRQIFHTAEQCDQWITELGNRVAADGWGVYMQGYATRFEGHPSGPFDLVCLPLPQDGYRTEGQRSE